MRRHLGIGVLTLGLVAACGGGATPSPEPTPAPTPLPTEVPHAASAEPEPSAEPTEAAGTRYKVRKGDTMWAIAQEFGVSLKALRAANPDVDPTRMRVGTVLTIPAP
ncbi:MAG: LysM peptidoglycan-binding domain-containing protein [Chloroflexi bacterium]|jgi:LysM repeat protein|nr:LysM peptidoglycan-binding domain-containing protein [Chloroflexota bacterium]